MAIKPKLTIAAVATLAAASLAACGGKESTEGGISGDKTITIGISSIQSGAAASSGLSLKCTVEAYLDAANKSGGINGYTFETISRDHQYDPSRAANIARQFVSDDVFLMLTDGTATMNAALPAIKPRGIPIFATADGAVFTPPKYDAMFGINPNYAREAAGGARFIIDELHETQTAIAYLNSEAGEPAAKAFPAYVEAHGGKVLASEAIASTSTDYTAQANKLKASGAKVVYSFLLDTGLAALQKASDSIGYHPTWVSWFPAYTPSYLDLAGPLAEGTYVSQFATPLSETSNEGVSTYLDIMQKACPDAITAQAAQSASSFAAAIVAGVEKATEGGAALTREGFIEAIKGEDQAYGLTPSVTWTDQTHAGATKAAMYQIKGGKLVAITRYDTLPESE
ncbi:ABC transporter substrate-binding protein [Micromonospora sp. NPDC006766]|uniref:ABC transporter substrate-binding protein n=1 Tax=Micromonospora sp. NPDC006766 TaxID=3154778 RepID=UPI0033F37719